MVGGVPARLIAGDAWAWRIVLPAELWPEPAFALAWRITPEAGGAPVTAAATRDGDAVALILGSPVTAAMVPGRWAWALFATGSESGDRITVDSGLLTVAPDPAAAGDRRSVARRMLEAIEARIAGRITRDAESYEIEGRKIVRIPFAELVAHRARLAREVAAEEAAAGGRPGGVVRYRRVRFSDAWT